MNASQPLDGRCNPASKANRNVRAFAVSGRKNSASNSRLSAQLQNMQEKFSAYRLETERERRGWLAAQSELLSASQRYSALIDLAPVAHLLLDSHGCVRDANLAAAQLFGISPTDLVDTPLSRFVAKPDRRKLLSHLYLCRHSEPHPTACELKFITEDGRSLVVRLVSLKVSTATDMPRRRPFCHTALVDLTELRRQEQSERDLAMIVQSSANAIYGLDLRGKIVSWNPAAEKLYGYSAEEAIGQSVKRLIPRNRQTEERRIWDQTHGGKIVRNHETMCRRKDGGLVEVALTASPIRGVGGRINGACVITHDISSSKELERQARRQTDKLENMLAIIPSAVWIAEDKKCRKMYGNAYAANLLGLPQYNNESSTPWTGQPVDLHFYRDGRRLQPRDLPMQKAAATGKDQTPEELEIELPKGGRRILLGGAVPLLDENNRVTGAIGAFNDITERKQAQEILRRTNELLEQRVRERTSDLQRANASLREEIQTRRQLQNQLVEVSEREQRRIGQDMHDGLGQHLTGVAMLADLLRNRLDQNEVPDKSNVRRLVTLLAQARSFARQLAHGLHPVANDPIGLMKSLEQLAQNVNELQKVKCHFHCERKILFRDNDKATHLFRIAQEAINNAIRHGRCKHIEVRLSEYHNAIRLEIWNDGRKWLKKKDHKRNGIGLQIMKSRCEAMNGSMEITSSRSRGTTVACVIFRRQQVIQK